MTGTSKRIYAYALAIGGAAIAIAAVGGAGLAHSISEDASTSCDVVASTSGGGFALEAVYHAEDAVAGAYQFSVKSVGGAGRTNINQGGGFSARSGETLTLGRVTVGGAAAYDVSLTIDLGGTPITCGGRVNASA
jgi:hypothetical protein